MTNTNSALPLVLVVGATGFTGGSIVKGLLGSNNFRVSALVRPASQSKPAIQVLRTAGVDIRLGDITDGVEKLMGALSGVNILVVSVVAYPFPDQRDLIRAAKEVGVQRVIPCDFGTPGKRGLRQLHDGKLEIRDFVKELGVPHTFIDVGWWMQLAFPLPSRSKVPEFGKQLTYMLHGTGTQKFLVTDLADIGVYVARILADPRTLNQAVIVWEDEVTELQVHEIGERESGEAEALKAKRIYVSAEKILEIAAEGIAEVAQDPANFFAHAKQSWNQYMNSVQTLGENTLENAKRLGYLDARELYPDLPKRTIEDFAKDYYTLEEPGLEYLRV
ncbi:NAD-P-binding protein [Lenzites betulinus]|nr:NAD-P-binding protein [Lenzites betulinus]